MSQIIFDEISGKHSFVSPSGKVYASVNKSYIYSKYASEFNKAVSEIEGEVVSAPVVDTRTDKEIWEDIEDRFNTMDMMVHASLLGMNRSMVISGPGGLGKSFGVMKALESSAARYTVVKGHITPNQLYLTLWKNRNSNNIVVFDDSDGIFDNETMLNLLKAACDSSSTRRISWLTSREAYDEEGNSIPTGFDFEGSVIFITNQDFNAEIERGTRRSVHFEALRSRSHYVSLGIKTKRDYIIRIKQVLAKNRMNDEKKSELIEFIEVNKDNLLELSLRLVNKLENLMQISPNNWRKLARTTLMKA